MGQASVRVGFGLVLVGLLACSGNGPGLPAPPLQSDAGVSEADAGEADPGSDLDAGCPDGGTPDDGGGTPDYAGPDGGHCAPTEATCAKTQVLDGRRYACTLILGTFTNVFLTGPDCLAGPTATCTEGTLDGDLRGTYAFFFDAQQPAGDPTAPTRQTFIGHSDVRLEDGSHLAGNDFGDITFVVGGLSPFRTTIDVRGVSGPQADARGHILARGTVDLVTSLGSGTYSGELCVPE